MKSKLWCSSNLRFDPEAVHVNPKNLHSSLSVKTVSIIGIQPFFAYNMFNDEALVELSHPKYWDGRYRSEQKFSQSGTQPILDSYEWFRSFKQLRPFFEDNLPPSSSGCHILHLGCGNSVIILFPQWFLCAQEIRRLITSPNCRD